MSRNIFLEKTITCPACKHISQAISPNPRFYAAGSRDEDQRITSYTWVQGIQTDVLPHHYAVYQCNNCLFADTREKFETPATPGLKEKALTTTFQSLPFDKKMVLRRLRRFVTSPELDAQAAMSIHLAAIFITMLPQQEEERDHLKMGRLLLRLSWLFREQQGEAASAESGTVSKTLATLEQSASELHEFVKNLGQAMTMTRQLAAERGHELQLPPDKNPYAKIFSHITEHMVHLKQSLAGLSQALQKDKEGKLAEFSPRTEAASASLASLLPMLSAQWPDMPQHEDDAIKKAVDAFDYSIRYEDAAKSVQQSMGLIHLVVKLLVKINDLERALKYIVDIFKTGFRDKQEVQSRINQARQEKTPNESLMKELNKQLGAISGVIEMAVEMRRKVLALLYERQKEQITAVLKQYAEHSPQEQEQAIIQAGFTEELIPWLKENRLLKEEEKKKKWFGS